jgi:hypothetical protein
MRPQNSFDLLRCERKMIKSSFAFGVLCIASVAEQLLERYGLLNWGVVQDGLLVVLMLGGLALMSVVFAWSLLSVRRYKIRSILGGLTCAFSLWMFFQNGKILF